MARSRLDSRIHFDEFVLITRSASDTAIFGGQDGQHVDVIRHAVNFHAQAAEAVDDTAEVLVKLVFDGRRDVARTILRAEDDMVAQLGVGSGHANCP